MESIASAGQPESEFYFDLGSIACYGAAEYLLRALPGAVRWRPVLAEALPGGDAAPPTDRVEALTEWSAAADLLPLQLPDRFPFASRQAMLAATFTDSIGQLIAFSMAAFRQAFAAGRALDQLDNILIAAAACELHPRAVTSAIERPATRGRLAAASARAAAAGVTTLPAISHAGRLHHDARSLDAALTRQPDHRRPPARTPGPPLAGATRAAR